MALPEKIQERIEEKETLLKEVHHRVKNNLQTVSSLLSLQSRAIDDSKISSIIKSSQNRVVSMAMVHDMIDPARFRNQRGTSGRKLLYYGFISRSRTNGVGAAMGAGPLCLV